MSGLARVITTVGGVGNLRPAPGTWGSAVALPLAWALHALGGFSLFLVATLAVFFAGWWATSVMIRGADNHDPSEIVVDEVVGQWIALAPLSLSAWSMGIAITVLWPGWITAFLFFPLFDIGKWGPVGVFDRRDDAFGVMMDDVFAGLLAAMVVLALAVLYHGVIAR